MKKIVTILLLIATNLTAGIPMEGPYLSPSEQLIRRETRLRIERKLNDMHLPLDLIPFFDSIASLEDWGHLGYHGANQGFRVYQDIIRFTIEELVGIPIREDFHFLRVPGDPDLNLNSMKEFENYWGKIDNTSEKRAKQLLSMNFGIYSNFDVKGSCSVNLFVKDMSKTKINYAKILAPFFKDLGLPQTALSALFEIGHKWFDEEGGILLQVSERSHLDDISNEAYNFADTQGYPAKKRGYRYGTALLSNHFERLMTDQYVQKKLDISPQLRLLINTRYTLNPFSYLNIKRYDLYDSQTVSSYEEEMRNLIRSLPYDALQIEKFQQELLKQWLD